MKRGLVVLSVLGLAVAGCGGGDDGPGKINTGVPGNTQLGGLSQSDVDKICKALDAHAKTISPTLCKAAGVLAAVSEFTPGQPDATLRVNCQTAYDACLKEPVGSSMCQKPINCTATVAELEACINEATAQFTKLFAPFPVCGALSLAKLNELAGMLEMDPEVEEPAACKAIQQKCPGFEIPIGMP